jgi:hypothetical protein
MELVESGRIFTRCFPGKLPKVGGFDVFGINFLPEPVFVNVYGAQESIPRNRFRQLM